MPNNELKMNYLKPNCFEKTKVRWGIFSFFSYTNVETKNVCPIAYNGSGISDVADFQHESPIRSTTVD